MISGSVARRYARAMLELATEAGIAEKVGDDLQAFVGLIEENQDLGWTLFNPGFAKAQRRGLLDALLPKCSFDRVTENFLRLLIDKSRIDHLPAIVREYGDLNDVQLGRVRAVVRSSIPIQSSDVSRLKDLLEKVTSKQVLLEQQVDPSLIGGMVTQVGGLVFDGSIRTQLSKMRQRLITETV